MTFTKRDDFKILKIMHSYFFYIYKIYIYILFVPALPGSEPLLSIVFDLHALEISGNCLIFKILPKFHDRNRAVASSRKDFTPTVEGLSEMTPPAP